MTSLKVLRQHRGITQEAMAHSLHMTQANYSIIENHYTIRQLHVGVLDDILKIFHITREELEKYEQEYSRYSDLTNAQYHRIEALLNE